MKTLLALLVLLLASPAAAAGFQRVLGGTELDRGVFVSPTRDGGYVIVGVTEGAGQGGEDVYFVRTDAAGAEIWTRALGGPATDNGWAVCELDDGFAIAGFTDSFGAGGFDFYLIVTDGEGEPRWTRTYGSEVDDRCWGLLPTADGGFLLVGETLDTADGSEDILLMKVDGLGQEQWSRRYGGDEGDRAFSIAPAPEGGFLLAGQTYSEGAGDRDAYLIRVDAEGTESWTRTFGGPASDVAHGVVSTADGNFLVTGYTTSFAESGDDPYLIKISPEGETLWTRTLPVAGVCRAITGAQGIDGDFFLTGFRHDPAKGSSAAILVRTNPRGELEELREFLPTATGQSFGYTVRATADGGCVFTGHTTEGSAGDLDALLVKVGPGIH